MLLCDMFQIIWIIGSVYSGITIVLFSLLKETKIAQLQDEVKAMKQSQQKKRTSSVPTQTSPMSSPATILNPPVGISELQVNF